MTNFKIKIKKIARDNSPIILANDYDFNTRNLKQKTISNIKTLQNNICGIKLNFHLLLPLGKQDVSKITTFAHDCGLVVIADIKLNDIGNTNFVTLENLWDMGFDAVIANPIMGLTSLKNLVSSSHKRKKGVISLCHMSAPEAKLSYDLDLRSQSKKLYQLFLKWAIDSKVDGIIAGATYPEIIRYCQKTAKGRLSIYSPGIGTQGGDVKTIVSAGTDYLIVGRTIINSPNPLQTTRNIHQSIFSK